MSKTTKINWITCSSVPSLMQQEVTLHLASPILPGDDVCDRPYLYGAILKKDGSTEKFTKDDGSVRDRTLSPHLPFAFEGSQEFLAEIHKLNQESEDLEKGVTTHSALRKGTIVKLRIVDGAVHIKGRNKTVGVRIVRALAIVGWKELEMVTRIKEEKEKASVPEEKKGVSRASLRRPAPSMPKRSSK